MNSSAVETGEQSRTTSTLYRTLDRTTKEVRLLVVEPGSGDRLVRCQFHYTSLSGETWPSYETVSYVWGEPDNHASVDVSGHQLRVPTSAATVLKRLRYPAHPRTLWIDAVCIDQANVSERSHQVGLMCDIYSQATKGLIWLGEDDGSALEALEAIHSLFEEARLRTQDFATFKEIVNANDKWLFSLTPTAVQYRAAPLTQFFSSSWFSRLWVVQEAALPKHSICYHGAYNIPLIHVLTAAVWLYHMWDFLPSMLPVNCSLAKKLFMATYVVPWLQTRSGSEARFADLLLQSSGLEVSDPRDCVYALLGLYQRLSPTHRDLPLALTPDYDRSVRDIYRDATRFAICEKQSLVILHQVSHHDTDELYGRKLPTWVPQWNRKWYRFDDPGRMHDGHADQSFGLPSTLARDLDPDVLVAVGFLVDGVKAIAEVSTLQVLTDIDSLLAQLGEIESMSATSRHRRGEVGHTLVSAHSHNGTTATREQTASGYRAWMRSLKDHHRIPLLFTDHRRATEPEARPAAEYGARIPAGSGNRRFFVTNDGYMGMGPKIMRPGDLVTVLYGCDVPVVLRHRAGTDTYAVVGVAYVDTIMDGEAYDAHKASGAVDVTFSLI